MDGPPPPPPPAPAPPPPPPVTASDPGRNALLGSIQNFSSAKLKKVKTNDKKPDDRPLKSPSAPSGGSGGGSRPAGAGPSGFGDIFAGGMPKLKSRGGVETGASSPASNPTPGPTPVGNPTPKPNFVSVAKPGAAPHLKPSTGVLRTAPVLSKAPAIAKTSATPKPAAAPASKPAAPVQPAAPKPTPAPTPVEAPPAPKHEDPVEQVTTTFKSSVSVESNITPSGNSAPAPAPAPTPAPTPTQSEPPKQPTPTFKSQASPAKPATGGFGKTPVNWVQPGQNVSPIGRVVQTASVHTAPKVTSSAKAAPVVKPVSPAVKPAPVSAPAPSTTHVAKPTPPVTSTIHKPVEPPKPVHTPTPPAPAPAPAHTPTPAPAAPAHTHTHTTHTHTHIENEQLKPASQPPASHTTTRSFPPPAATNTSSGSLNNSNTSPRSSDSDELFCHRCKQSIEGSHYKAMDRAWHIDHFTCNDCHKKIQSFVVHLDQPYCEDCYDRSFVEHKQCFICTKPIFGTVVSALGNSFHEECFKCNECGTHFPDKEFYQLEGKPYCFTCVTKATAPKYEACDGCGEQIVSRGEGVIKVLGRKFHNNNKCFSCSGCRVAFPALNFYEVNNNPYCLDCASKLVG